MRKGQLTFDLVFAIIAFLLLLQFLVTAGDNFEQNQNELLLRDQAHALALSIANQADFQRVYYGTYSLSFQLPYLQVEGKKQVPCTVTVLYGAQSGNEVNVTALAADSGLFEDVTVIQPLSAPISGYNDNGDPQYTSHTYPGTCGSLFEVHS